jgi:drug/metabolite transporter (DMT)-like permease
MTLQSTAVNRPMSLVEWAMLLTLSVLWGGSFFFNEVAVAELPVFTVVVGRVALAAVILLAVCRAAGVRFPADRRVLGAFLGMGLLNNAIPFSLIVLGQTQIASGVASILNATTPMFTVLVAHVLTGDEKLNPARVFGVVAGFAGVAVMIGLQALEAVGDSLWAQLACLAGALSYAVAGVYGRRFRRLGVAPLATATGQVVASSLCLIPLMALVDRPWTLPAPSWEALGALAGVATLSTALAYVLYFRILATAGATNLLLVTLLIPVTAVLLGVGVLGETLALRHLLGIAVIAVGLAAIDGRPLRALRRR